MCEQSKKKCHREPIFENVLAIFARVFRILDSGSRHDNGGANQTEAHPASPCVGQSDGGRGQQQF